MRSHLRHLVKNLTLKDGTPVTLRPIRPADAHIEQQFVRELSAEARYYRFMDMLHELSPALLKQLTEIDFDRHVAVIAVTPAGDGEKEIAVGRYVVLDDGERCEFAIVVADGWQGNGIATALMQILIQSARERGVKKMYGEILASNNKMLHLVRKLGFHVAMDANDPRQVRATLDLAPA